MQINFLEKKLFYFFKKGGGDFSYTEHIKNEYE